MAPSSDPVAPAQWIDLHAHTDESDGTFSPQELVALAGQIGLSALAVTDHDTLDGFAKAMPFARQAQLDLVCGIELNTRMLHQDPSRRAAHLLAYFLSGEPSRSFVKWLHDEKETRRNRNRNLVEALQKQGIEITLSEIESRGRSLAGRPHFARILVEKGYARNGEEAFRKFLGEQAPGFVRRQSKPAQEVIAIIRDGGGIPVVAHPVRLGLSRQEERELLISYREAGLLGLEVYHSEHPPELQAHYRQLAEELELMPTGGSDFHGGIKPGIQLGTGMNANLRVPKSFLDELRSFAAKQPTLA